MAAPFPVVQVQAQFTPGTWTDISAFARSVSVARPVTRQQGPLWQYQAGTASITLKNPDGRFDPDNLAGPYISSTGLQQVVWTAGPGSTKTWTAPRNLSGTTIQVECWGSSSTGIAGTGAGAGAGGGGGEYAREAAYAVIGGNNYNVVCPAGNSASSTTFDGTGVVAHAATPNSATPGSGSTNSVHFNGGTGGAAGTGNTAKGGGGGSSAGSASAGGNGTAGNSGGTGGVAPAGGYGGGKGAPDGRYAGQAGLGPGGGGGGGAAVTNPGSLHVQVSPGGQGRGGQVVLTYFVTITNVATVTQVLPRVPVQVNATWPVPALATRTSPPAFGNISIVNVVTGTWTVSWSVTLSGTLGAGDANNFQLTNGGTFVAQSVNAASAGTYAQATQVLTFTGGAPFVQVIAGAATPTTGAVYGATISVAYSLFTGTADAWTDTGINNKRYSETVLTATDGFKILSRNNLPATSPLGANDDSGARISRILDIAGWSASARQIDTGDTFQQATTLGSNALALLQLTADTEIGEVYINGAGLVVFRHRQAILNDTRSTFPQAVFGDQPGTQNAQVTWHGDGVHGSILVSANPPGSFFAAATPASKQMWVWSSVAYAAGVQLVIDYYDSTLTIISTSTGTVTATGPVPVLLSVSGTSPAGTVFLNVQPQVQGTPAASVIFSGVAAPPLDGNDVNFSPANAPWTAGFFTTITTQSPWVADASVPGELPYAGVGKANDDTTLANDIQITNTGSSNLQEATDPVSVFVYQAESSYTRTDLLLPDDPTALEYANWVLYISKNSENRFDTLTVNPLRDPADLFPQVLGREIGDRIQIWRTQPGVAARVTKDVFIRGIQHDFDASAHTWQTSWTLQSAAKYSGFMTLDSAINGLLDTNALAY